jgi:3-oxoacyl-[acyl-carrier-protein] synthase III
MRLLVYSKISAIDYYLPQKVELNDPDDKLTAKIGIFEKHIAAEDEFASDLAIKAAEKLFARNNINPGEIDYILYCSQSPEYYLPSTACILQDKLSIPKTAGALDFNLGCSGFVYGLSLAKGLIESGQVKKVLLITSDTYSKYINNRDRSVKLLFGDAAAATLIEASEIPGLENFSFGTDGKGAQNLIVPAGGIRQPLSRDQYQEAEDQYGNIRSNANLYMNGPEIFNFTLREIPKSINDFLETNQKSLADFDRVIFHQANEYMLTHLRKKMKISDEKFSIQLRKCGNTVSSSIPIALKMDLDERCINKGDRLLIVGFGVGYSWAVGSLIY